jgi:hypothetical protein
MKKKIIKISVFSFLLISLFAGLYFKIKEFFPDLFECTCPMIGAACPCAGREAGQFVSQMIVEEKSKDEEIEGTEIYKEASRGPFTPIDWKSCYDLPRKLITCEPFTCVDPVGPRITSHNWPLQSMGIYIDGLTKDNKCNFRYAMGYGGLLQGEPNYFIIKCFFDKSQSEEVSKYYQKLIDTHEKDWWSLLGTKEMDDYTKGNPFKKLIANGHCIAREWKPD